MNKSLFELLEIVISGDRDKNSFQIRNNFEKYHNEFPFLHNTIGVGTAVERILENSKNETQIKLAIDKIGKSEDLKYTRRNYTLILADFYLEKNDVNGLETIITEYLREEFKFHGYRKLLIYYSNNYDESKFLDIFKRIEKRNTLMPIDRNGINSFIEKYSSNCKNITEVKELIRKNKIYPKIEDFIKPMLLGYFENQDNFQEIEKVIINEIDTECDRFSFIEDVYNELFNRSNNKNYKLKLLLELENLSLRIPKELKVNGYPSKMWTLLLWRVGCKYLELDNREKVEQIIIQLTGKNKKSLKEMYDSKYKE